MPSVGYREKTDKVLAKRHDASSHIKASDKETCVSGRRQMGFFLECLKFLLLAFRILLPLIALAELVGAIIVLVHLFPYHDLFHEPILGPGIGLVGLAIAVGLSAYLVGKATTSETKKQCLLLGLVVFLSLMSVMHVADVVWALLLRATITPPATALLESIRNNSHLVDWDRLQSTLECCGASGSADHLARDPKKFPTSCCVPAKKSEAPCTYTYQRGCAQPLFDEVRIALGWAAIDGVSTFMFLVLVTILAFYFRRQVRRMEADDDSGASDALVTT